jgi:putative ABC transport system permease protein
MFKLIAKITNKTFSREKNKLLLSFLSLFIGALVLTVVLGLISSVRNYLTDQTKELIGGDVVIQQSFPIDVKSSKLLKNLLQEGAVFSEKMQTVVIFTNKSGKTLVCSLRVVADNYPLYGTLLTKSGKNTLPGDNEIIAEPDFMDRFGIKVNDQVTSGFNKFKVKDIIEMEPDRFGAGFSFGPKVIMNFKGWERTGINKFASRITYYLSIKLPEKLYNEAMMSKIEAEFKAKGSQVSNAIKGPTQLNNILDAWERFFLTITVLTLFLIMINIRSNLVYLLNYFTKTIAVFRVLGMRKSNIIAVFSLLLLLISISSGIIGNLAGNGLIYLMIPSVEKLVGVSLARPFILSNCLMIITFTVVLCLISAISALLKILEIEPKMVLSQNFERKSNLKSLLKEGATSLFIGLGLFGAIYYLTQKVMIAVISIASITAAFIFFTFIVKIMMAIVYRKRFRLDFFSRTVVNFVKNQGLIGETAIASLTLALAGIFTIALVQFNIVQNLQGPLSTKMPNLYVIDIQDPQIKPVKDFFKNEIKLFPNVRARLMRIDKRMVQTDKKEKEQELKREFNLTYRTDLIEGEKLVEGIWHGEKLKKSVSLEKKFAERAGIRIGSEVEFMISGMTVKAKVTSIRTVEKMGLPFFFFVFSPDVIQDAPKTVFGYVYVPEKNIPEIQSQLAQKFPNVFSLPTSDIIKTIRLVTETILSAVLLVSIPALILGILLIFSMLINSSQERFKDLLLFKVLGAGRKKIFRLYFYENIFFILFSSVFAIIFSTAGSFAMNKYFFSFDSFYFNPLIFAILVIVFTFAVSFSLYLIRKMFMKRPAELFRS